MTLSKGSHVVVTVGQTLGLTPLAASLDIRLPHEGQAYLSTETIGLSKSWVT